MDDVDENEMTDIIHKSYRRIIIMKKGLLFIIFIIILLLYSYISYTLTQSQ